MRAEEDLHMVVHYGQLLNLYILHLPQSVPLGLQQPETLVLACIKPVCPIERLYYLSDAIPFFCTNDTGTLEIVDLSVLSAVVGRINDGNETYILDRTSCLNDPELIEST